ncbi:MAG: iron-sulfur cluster assembly protein, partial [Pseudomonadota bacterium]
MVAANGPVGEREILQALGRVGDPDRPGSIVELGMVTGLAVRDGHVSFAIEVAPERGPRLEPLRKAAEAAVHAIPGVLSVTAVLTAHRAGATAQPAAPRPHGHG